jgi:TatD DNase family protein
MLIDHHCHLDFPDFASDLDGVVARAAAAGVRQMVTISTHVRRFDRLLPIIERFDDVYGSIGTHPHNADEEAGIPASELIKLSRHPKVVAIGEAGLDYYYKKSTPQNQADGFRTHIMAARETGLPLEIHTRDAEEDTAAILTAAHADGPFPALLHCFTGGRELALRAVDLGLYVSFSGVVSFKKAEALRAIACEIPLDRILVETDAPFLAPDPFRGKTNEPAYVVHTARAIAAARGLTEAEFAAATTDNFYRLFTKARRPADTLTGTPTGPAAAA